MPDEGVLQVARPFIRKALSERDRKIFDQIKFSFPDTINYMRVSTIKSSDGERLAEISQGFLQLNLGLTIGVYQSLELKPKRSFGSYLSYLASKADDGALRFEQGGPPPMYPPYSRWAGIPDDQADAVSAKYRDRILSDYTSALVFAVLHETAHHLNSDVGRKNLTDSQRRDQEYKADLFAIKTLKKMGLDSAGLAPIFLLLTALEGDVDRIQGTHDPAVCRAALMGKQSRGRALVKDNEVDWLQEILTRCERAGP